MSILSCVFATQIFLRQARLSPFMDISDYIIAELACPEKKVAEEHQIHIEWREKMRFHVFQVGDVIEGLFPKYSSAWIRTQYVCNSCSGKGYCSQGAFIRNQAERWHPCYIRMEDGKVAEIITQEEFSRREIDNVLVDENNCLKRSLHHSDQG